MPIKPPSNPPIHHTIKKLPPTQVLPGVEVLNHQLLIFGVCLIASGSLTCSKIVSLLCVVMSLKVSLSGLVTQCFMSYSLIKHGCAHLSTATDGLLYSETQT